MTNLLKPAWIGLSVHGSPRKICFVLILTFASWNRFMHTAIVQVSRYQGIAPRDINLRASPVGKIYNFRSFLTDYEVEASRAPPLL